MTAENNNSGSQIGRPIDEVAREWEETHKDEQTTSVTPSTDLGESLRKFMALFNAPADNLDELRSSMLEDLVDGINAIPTNKDSSDSQEK